MPPLKGRAKQCVCARGEPLLALTTYLIVGRNRSLAQPGGLEPGTAAPVRPSDPILATVLDIAAAQVGEKGESEFAPECYGGCGVNRESQRL